MQDAGSKKTSKSSMQAKPMPEVKGKTPMSKPGSSTDATSGAPTNGGSMKGKNQK